MALKGMRVKAQTGKNYGNTRVEFDSPKNRCKVVAQSMLEFIEFMRLEADPEVASYVPHPGVITMVDDTGNEVRALFDAEVTRTDDRPVYEEVKYTDELKEGAPEGSDPFRSIRQVRMQETWCKQRGYDYRIVTEEDLFQGKEALLSNVLFITQRLRPERIDDMGEVIAKAASVYQKILDHGGRCIISDLIDGDAEDVMTAVCFLIKEGRANAAIETVPLFYGSEVWIDG